MTKSNSIKISFSVKKIKIKTDNEVYNNDEATLLSDETCCLFKFEKKIEKYSQIYKNQYKKV